MRVALLGDIALFGHCTTSEYFQKVSDYLSGFDYVVGNLETPFSGKKKTHGAKSAYISADPSLAPLLNVLHLKAVSLANNHMFDYGREGYELTKKLLNESGIEWFGTEGKELTLEKDENKLAFAGYCCYSTNPLQCLNNGKYGVNAYNLLTTEKFIAKSIENGFLPIVAVHAGLEHVNYPSLDHIRAARKMADRGAYVYYGHHPHVIQGLECHNGALIAHSLGNFCFDDVYTSASKDKPLIELTENNRTGMVLELTVEKSVITGWKEQIIHIGAEGIELSETPLEIQDYNLSLEGCENDTEEYNKRRISILNKRADDRKSSRDLKWYLRRLRPRYVRLILDMRKNNRLYIDNVKNSYELQENNQKPEP